MAGHLTDWQCQVLEGLAGFVDHEDGAPDASDLARWIFRDTPWALERRGRLHDSIAACLRRMEQKGWTQRLGKTADGAQCWGIRDAGRMALTPHCDGCGHPENKHTWTGKCTQCACPRLWTETS